MTTEVEGERVEVGSNKQHCLHATGSGSSWGGGGSEWHYCCYCNEKFTLGWEIEHKQIIGHGPYGKYQVKILSGHPEEPCPKRT